jgi:hypothetical protein
MSQCCPGVLYTMPVTPLFVSIQIQGCCGTSLLVARSNHHMQFPKLLPAQRPRRPQEAIRHTIGYFESSGERITSRQTAGCSLILCSLSPAPAPRITSTRLQLFCVVFHDYSVHARMVGLGTGAVLLAALPITRRDHHRAEDLPASPTPGKAGGHRAQLNERLRHVSLSYLNDGSA